MELVQDLKQELDKYSAIGIGPGIGLKKSMKEAFREILTNTKVQITHFETSWLNIHFGRCLL